MQEESPEVFVNGENAMPVGNVDKFKGHGGSAFHGIFIAAGGAEPAVAAERDKLKLAAVGAAIHGATERRITTVYHLVDIFHLSFSGMKGIFNFLVMVSKNFL